MAICSAFWFAKVSRNTVPCYCKPHRRETRDIFRWNQASYLQAVKGKWCVSAKPLRKYFVSLFKKLPLPKSCFYGAIIISTAASVSQESGCFREITLTEFIASQSGVMACLSNLQHAKQFLMGWKPKSYYFWRSQHIKCITNTHKQL